MFKKWNAECIPYVQRSAGEENSSSKPVYTPVCNVGRLPLNNHSSFIYSMEEPQQTLTYNLRDKIKIKC